jgi:ketosteroid isomerase-like protein
MSHDNVEVVTRWFELVRRGDTEAALQFVDPAGETREGPELPGATSYFGHAGAIMAYENWAEQWDDFSMELEELVDAGSEVVLVTRHRGTGRASGCPSRTWLLTC